MMTTLDPKITDYLLALWMKRYIYAILPELEGTMDDVTDKQWIAFAHAMADDERRGMEPRHNEETE